MLSLEDDTPDTAEALRRLESIVNKAARTISDLRAQLAQAEERATQSDELLREFVGGKQDPAVLSRRLKALEDENAALREKILEGRTGIDQVLAQIQFLEGQR